MRSEMMRQATTRGGGRCGRCVSGPHDVSLEESLMTLLTLLNKTELMWSREDHTPSQAQSAAYS